MRALKACALLAMLIASGCGGDDEGSLGGTSGGGQGGTGGTSGGTGGSSGISGGGGTNAAGAGGGDSGAGATSGASGTSGAGGEGGDAGGAGGDAGTSGAGGMMDGGDSGLSGTGGGDPNVGMLSDAQCTLEEPWACKVCDEQDESCLIPELTVNGDGTISSACCGLVWQATPLFINDPESPNDDCDEREGDPGCFTWDEARDYCASLDLAGGGFRLPKAVEIKTLYVRGMGSPYIDRDAFPNIPTGDVYWTASESELSANEAWCGGFGGTFSARRQKSSEHFVLCVR